MPRRRRFRLNWLFFFAVAVFIFAIVSYVAVGVGSAALSPKRIGVPSDLKLIFIARSLDATLAVWFFAVGASIGSFLNVVAYRLPLGRTLGGHSACPFCNSTIAASDNIPVFAWIRLRGRCRICRLPISIQYPLVELGVGIVFLLLYFREFAIGGSNLPRTMAIPAGMGLVWTSVTQTLAIRVLLWAITLSGLIAAALMLARRSFPPWHLFAWIMLVLIVAETALPSTVVVPWWAGVSGGQSPFPSSLASLDSLIQLTLGMVAGGLVATVSYPLLSQSTRWAAWLGVSVCLGALLGWQSTASAIVIVLLVRLAAGGLASWILHCRCLETRDRGQRTVPLWLGDPVVWSWLGLLVFRSNWKVIDDLLRWPGRPGAFGWAVALEVLVLLLLAWVVGRITARPVKHNALATGYNDPL